MEDQANTLSAALARDSPGTGQRRKTNVGQAMNRQLGLRKPRDVRLISLQCRDILQPMTASQPCTGYERIATTRTMAMSVLMGFRSHLLRDTFDERAAAYESRLRRPSCISQYHAESGVHISDIESTAGEIGQRPAPAVAPPEMREDQCWQNMLKAMEGYSENVEEQHLDKSGAYPQISPGISELLRTSTSSVSSMKTGEGHEARYYGDSMSNDSESTKPETRDQVIYGPRFDYPPMSTSSDTRQPESCQESSEANDQAPVAIENAPQSHHTPDSSGSLMRSSTPMQLATDPSSSLCAYPEDNLDEQPADGEPRITIRACSSDEDLSDFAPHAKGLDRDREIRDGQLASERKLNLDGTAQSDELEKPMFASQIIQPEENEPPPVVDKAQKEAEEEAAWMNFIFDGDIDDAEKAAFQEAAQEAARVIRPSSSVSESPIDNSTTSSSSHYAETVATCGTSTFLAANGNVFSSRFSPDPHFGHPAKRTPFPPKFFSDPDLKLSSAFAERGHQTYHDHSETYRHSMPYNETSMTSSSHPGYFSRTTVDNMTDGAASQLTIDNASIIAQPSQSEASEEAAFTFTQPKNFVGSRVTSAAPMSMTLCGNNPSAPKKPNKGRKKKGHQPQAKRSHPHRDGSAFIRALPNYNDDPIDGSDD
ncbi:hypothetical protein CGCF415_v009799 [Colletotrichum fructicola]|nr:hypothetical protein CGCF415_v009799 [Colletotrichum fructicola]KAF4931333.1 hypothetical protein CGCF245_v011280 [Colletotrichum fructicola]